MPSRVHPEAGLISKCALYSSVTTTWIDANSTRAPRLFSWADYHGLLSTLDSIVNAPLADIIRPLPLDGEFKRAILQHTGDLGAILDAVLGYEAGHFDAAARHGVRTDRVQAAFWEAMEYSATMMSDLKTAAAQSPR